MAKLKLFLQVALGVAIGIAIPRVVPPEHAFFLPALISGLFVYVTLHEAGHAIAAVSQGFRITTFCVWPLAWRRTAKSWRIRFIRPSAFGFVGVDVNQADHLRRRAMILVAGGPAASAITAMAAIAIAWVASERWPEWSIDELKM